MFDGWYTDAALTDKVTTVKLNGNTTIYAKWAKNPDTGLPFTDVRSGDWFYDDAVYAFEKGLMNGTGSTTFSPNLITTRGMIVTILYRMENSPAVTGSNPFNDVADGRWYTDAITWAAANNIVSGYGEGKFGPNDSISREQMASILYRFAAYKGYDVAKSADLAGYTDAESISDYALLPMQWANAEGLITGTAATTLDPAGHATRAQVAAIIHRFCENVVG